MQVKVEPYLLSETVLQPADVTYRLMNTQPTVHTSAHGPNQQLILDKQVVRVGAILESK